MAQRMLRQGFCSKVGKSSLVISQSWHLLLLFSANQQFNNLGVLFFLFACFVLLEVKEVQQIKEFEVYKNLILFAE